MSRWVALRSQDAVLCSAEEQRECKDLADRIIVVTRRRARDRGAILLVEDNELNRDMLSRRLQRRGYEIAIAVDGTAGVHLAHSEAPSLILMDMSLPDLDGWEATRQIKANPND